MPAAYERFLAAPVFQPFAVDLARRVAARAPRQILELAAGTGVLTRELAAAAANAEITATDLNDAMVDLGRARVPEATWQPADAMSLPFDDGQFDVVACQFGVMFFPDKPAAYAECAASSPPMGGSSSTPGPRSRLTTSKRRWSALSSRCSPTIRRTSSSRSRTATPIPTSSPTTSNAVGCAACPSTP